MATRKNRSLDPTAPLNFLLTCSAATLDSFELARLNNLRNLRTDLHDILDKLIDEATQAALARWFKVHGREELKHALDNPPDILEEARQKIREMSRTKTESAEDKLTQMFSLPLGQAHRTASMAYQERNIADGKCMSCPKPLAHHSVRYCDKHLAMQRARHKPKNATGGEAGSLDYLYGGPLKSTHGRQPGTIKALAEAREKRKTK